ncbi:MAG TPA: hypothetical protein VMV81_10520 [Phycisphaerae bacterium]|nr:hypothetical protein [Phycisphaerae bacterium]
MTRTRPDFSSATSNGRQHDRRSCDRIVWIFGGSNHSLIRCRVDNLSETGLHATAPRTAHVLVGNRFETRLATERPDASAAAARNLGYATVTRTEPDEGGKGRIGFALCFDVPQQV